MRVLVKNAAEEEGIISDMRSKQERLLWGGAGERDEHVGDVFATVIFDVVRGQQSVGPRKSFQKRPDVIAKFPIDNASLLQNVPSEHVKIKLRRNAKLAGVGQNCINQPRMIENGIARFGVTQKIDQRNAIDCRSGEGAYDKVEIRGGEPRPTIRPDHREPSMSNGYASGKPVSFSSQMTLSML